MIAFVVGVPLSCERTVTSLVEGFARHVFRRAFVLLPSVFSVEQDAREDSHVILFRRAIVLFAAIRLFPLHKSMYQSLFFPSIHASIHLRPLIDASAQVFVWTIGICYTKIPSAVDSLSTRLCAGSGAWAGDVPSPCNVGCRV